MHDTGFWMIAATQAPATLSEWWAQYGKMLLDGIWGTIYMTLVSTAIGYLFGLPMGVALTVTDLSPMLLCIKYWMSLRIS